jgi:putative hydrolase of the HAD superfamily
MKLNDIKVIAFDADDTLWVNEPNYQKAEEYFCTLLNKYNAEKEISKELLRKEQQNIQLYGFGAKGFILSMIETAIYISDGQVDAKTIQKIINLGKELIEKPVELLKDIDFVLRKLKDNYTLVLATKGDLLDQQRKLHKSGLSGYFDHIEIMSDKNESDYQQLLQKLSISPENFLMVGNSLRSDILPVIAIGGQAVHIPYHITWQHEVVENPDNEACGYFKLSSITNLPNLLK